MWIIKIIAFIVGGWLTALGAAVLWASAAFVGRMTGESYFALAALFVGLPLTLWAFFV